MNHHPGHLTHVLAAWVSLSILFVPVLFGQEAAEENAQKEAEQAAPPRPPEANGPDSDLGPFEQRMAVVVNAGLDLAQRTEAAGQIIDIAVRDPESADLLGHVFTDAVIDNESARILARAVGRRSTAPDSLAAPLLELAQRLPESEAVDVIAALGSIRSQHACAALITFASPEHSAATRARAFDALQRLSAMRSLGVNYDAWQAWSEDASALEPDQWNLLLLENLARERDWLVRTRAADIARLVDVATQLNLATPSEQRSALLASYLLDARDEMRELGFDLVERELRQSSQLNGEVAQATITLLAHHNPAARRRAARVIDQIAPPEAGPAVAHALAAEDDPTVAAELLKASIRWPMAELEQPVVRWLIAGNNTFGPAARAALALRESGLLQDTASIERAVTALRARPIESLSESSLALFADIGETADRDRIAALLDSPNPPTSRAAAVALADRAEYLDHLLLAAQGQEHLLTIAADAVLNLRPTAAGYASIAKLLEVPEGETRDTTWLVRIAQTLSVDDLFTVAMNEADLDLREQMLSRLAEDGFTITEPQRDSFANALAELACLQTMHGQPESSLLTLDKVPAPSSVDPKRLAKLRATALIALNRLDDARQLDPPASAWLDALDSMLTFAPDPQLATSIVTELTTVFADTLTEAQTERLALLSGAVDKLVLATEQSSDANDPPPTGSGGG
jgi:hypothetical protein